MGKSRTNITIDEALKTRTKGILKAGGMGLSEFVEKCLEALEDESGDRKKIIDIIQAIHQGSKK